MMEVKNIDLWIFIISTIRYSMGRRTYMSELAPELMMRYKDALTPEQIKQIGEEIESELKINSSNPGYLGDDCDIDSWDRARRWCLEEQKK